MITGPTPEQAERINAAITQARSAPAERDQRLLAVEKAVQRTGDGLPEEVVASLIDTILDRTPPPPADGLLEELFGRLPDNLFEGLGQLTAIRALSERLAATLLRTLGYGGDLVRPPASLFNLCEEQAVLLSPQLRESVTDIVGRCRDLTRHQQEYEAQAMVRYTTGKFSPTPDWPNVTEVIMDDTVEIAARTVLDLSDLIDRCEQAKREGQAVRDH